MKRISQAAAVHAQPAYIEKLRDQRTALLDALYLARDEITKNSGSADVVAKIEAAIDFARGRQ